MGYKNPDVQRAYQAGYLAGRRQTWLQENGPCRQCQSWEGLELDHIDPATKTTHRVWSLSKAERDEELKKCQVLCRRCHREKTNATLAKPLVHGTRHGYAKHGCRCDACREENNKRARAWRDKWKLREGTPA